MVMPTENLMTYRTLIILALAFGLTACENKAPEAKPAAADKAEAKPAEKAEAKPAKKAEAKPTKPAQAVTKTATAKPADGKEIVFNPKTPPPGYVNCHRNHCHKVGGGVASYKQVMAEMGATKIEGVKPMAPMPAAPADVAAPPKDATTTKSGLAYKVITKGDGKGNPTATSVVTAHYTGWTTDGKAFDSSIARGKPASFPLNRVIPGWSEGLQLMSAGSEVRFWIPEALAYQGRPGRPAGMLVFDVELLEFK